jgi:hypothetical protein
MHFLYRYEHGGLKPVEVNLKRVWGRREKNGRNEPIQGIKHVYMERSQ